MTTTHTHPDTHTQPARTDSAGTDVEHAAVDIVGRLERSWAANDADAFADLYTADATVVLNGGVHMSGREEIRRFMVAGFAAGMRGSSTANELESARSVALGAAVLITTSAILMAGETSVPADRQRRATWTIVDEGGTWQIAAYANSAIA